MIARINGVPISSKFGSVDAVHNIPHTGVDIPLEVGTPIKAVADGVIERLPDYGTLNIGKGLVLRLDDGSRVIYGHLSEWKARVGQHVYAGQIIAASGDSGRSTGPHLHLGLMKDGHFTDPTRLADAVVVKANGPISSVKESLTKIGDALDAFKHGLEQLGYWLNPVNAWHELGAVISSGAWDLPLMAATVVGILIWALGGNWIKKWLFWGWVIFWLLRGFVFA